MTELLRQLADMAEAYDPRAHLKPLAAAQHVIDEHTDRIGALLGIEKQPDMMSDLRVALSSFASDLELFR